MAAAALMEFFRNDLFVCRKFVPLTRNGKCNCSVPRLLPFFEYDEQTNWSELVSTVARGDINALRSYLNRSSTMRLSDRYGNTPLHLSIIFKQKETFDYLLSLDGLNIDVANRYGQTCLHLAVIDELEEYVLALLRRGADVNFSDEACCTSLHVAATRATPRMCRLLLEHGADMHAQNLLGKSAIYHACQYGTEETACMLLFYGAEAAAIDRFGILPLTAAMQRAPHRHDFHEILFNYTFEKGRVSVNLRTLTTAMKIGSPLFPEMLKKVDGVKYSRNDLIELSRSAILIERGYFKMFMRKHAYVIWEMLQFSNELYHELTVSDNCDELASQLMDFLMMLFGFRRSFNFLKSSRCFGNLIPTLVSLYKEKKITMATLSRTVCFLYSYGLTCELNHLVAIYESCGHCVLFKDLLHMEIYVTYEQPKSLMPYLICDVRMTIDKLLNYVTGPCVQYRSVLKFFASQKLHRFFATDTEIQERLRELPEVPSLIELARNSARKHIIRKFRIKKTREFYDLIKRLPVCEVYKKILTYERELYVF